MAFPEDYAEYLRLANITNTAGFDMSSNLDLVRLFPQYVLLMADYEAKGLVAYDASRNLFVPTDAATYSAIAAPALPAPIYPGLQPYVPVQPSSPMPTNTAPTPGSSGGVMTPAPTPAAPIAPAGGEGMSVGTLLGIALGAYILGRR